MYIWIIHYIIFVKYFKRFYSKHFFNVKFFLKHYFIFFCKFLMIRAFIFVWFLKDINMNFHRLFFNLLTFFYTYVNIICKNIINILSYISYIEYLYKKWIWKFTYNILSMSNIFLFYSTLYNYLKMYVFVHFQFLCSL